MFRWNIPHSNRRKFNFWKLGAILSIPSAFLAYQYKCISEESALSNNNKFLLFKLFPLKLISKIFGKLSSIENEFIKNRMLDIYTSLYSCQYEGNLYDFKSLQNFFIRPLKRKIEWSRLVSPSDGIVMSCGPVSDQHIEQIKGFGYSVRKLFGTKNIPETNLHQITIYLRPQDYHRFHAPADMTLKKIKHFDGELFSVSKWMQRNIGGLFLLNERVALIGESKFGFMGVSLIGATNVGNIKLHSWPELQTNCTVFPKLGTQLEKEIDLNLSRGEEVGYFLLGSAIVLLFERKNFKFSVKRGDEIRYGQKL